MSRSGGWLLVLAALFIGALAASGTIPQRVQQLRTWLSGGSAGSPGQAPQAGPPVSGGGLPPGTALGSWPSGSGVLVPVYAVLSPDGRLVTTAQGQGG